MKKLKRNIFTEDVEKQKVYFRYAADEIEDTNIAILCMASVIMVIVTAVLFVLTPLVLPGWSVTKLHAAFFACMIMMAILSQIFRRASQRILWLSWALCYLFMAIVMVFILVVDTMIYTHAAATFIGIYMVAAPVLFIVPVGRNAVIRTVYMLIFCRMTIYYKAPQVAGADIFNAVLGLVIGIIVHEVIMNLRIKDFFQKNRYRMSSELDALTGLSNRGTSKNQMDQYLEMKHENISCALMILDIDDFKQVNDKLGHQMGDRVLKNFASVLKSQFRSSDVVGRYGGDEFIVFLKDIYDVTMIETKCQAIKEQMKRIMEGKFDISCSIGVALLSGGRATTEELFHMADEALYEAKTFVKGSYVQREFVRNTMNQDEKPQMVIIDDNMVDREVMALQFQEQFRISKFGDSVEGLAYIETHAMDISIILLDMIMPEMDGFELIHTIKTNPATSWIPVIAVSSDSLMEQKALEAGAADMIVKPVVPAVAKLRVNNVMKQLKKNRI